MAARKTVRDRKRVAAHKRLSRGVPKYDPAFQQEAQAFADANHIRCFKCKRDVVHWFKYGRQASGRPWALCTLCAKGPR